LKQLIKNEIAENWDNFSIPMHFEKWFVARLAGHPTVFIEQKKICPLRSAARLLVEKAIN
jgi:hypothetical protein